MSNYQKNTNFSVKDGFASGNPLKKIKGTEFDIEFDAIAVAIGTKVDTNNAALEGIPTTPTATVATDTSQVASTAFVHDVMPKGVILLWSGSIDTVPAGWAVCNGASGTPDLRNRFVVGTGIGADYAIGQTGGANAVALSAAEMPSHSHTGYTGVEGFHGHTGTALSAGNHSHGVGGGQPMRPDGAWGFRDSGSTYSTVSSVDGAHTHNLSINGAGSHTHSVQTHASGGGGAHENRPPFYALCCPIDYLV